ncbi:MAG: DUF2791 family P-loop domain-containing protein [bacterium]|nr:DUF2791 family P-loop domain-containing protein [bacterium]MCY4103266.1 DUF2791 family P-loop domain-containing protein [bacterium]
MTPDAADYDPLECRRALEALRSGVPNRNAVAILGCHQPAIQRRFDEMLTAAASTGDSGGNGGGMLVSGDFGAGKSHLLAHLEHEALAQGFVCSTVAVSKETPLYNLDKVFKSAVENSRMPERRGRLIEELGQALDTRSERYSDFFRWSDSAASGLNPIFPASLLVYERSDDPELSREIEDFWAGDRLLKSRVNAGLREIGQLANYSFRAAKAAELPPQRLQFLAQLIRATGHKGWVVLLDEIELVGQYSILQRARSYSELARWFGRVAGQSHPGLAVVATVTDDFALKIISPDGTKKDRDYVAARLASRYQHLTGPAETGMDTLERGAVPLTEPSDDDVAATLETLRRLYSRAYGWNASDLPPARRGAGEQNRMRYRVRAAISEWDLRRLYPEYKPEIVEEEFRHSYEEDPDLQRESPAGEEGDPTRTADDEDTVDPGRESPEVEEGDTTDRAGHGESIEPGRESLSEADAPVAGDSTAGPPAPPGAAIAPA